LQQKKSLKDNAIDLANELFNYANKKFAFLKVNEEEIYFKAKDIAEFLEYTNTNQAIMLHISEEEKITLEKLSKIRGLENRPLNWNDKNSIFISEFGLYELILSSKKKRS
jgi:prophage antirepressor-like protein